MSGRKLLDPTTYTQASVNEIKEMRKAGHVARMEDIRESVKIIVREHEGNMTWETHAMGR